MYWFIFFQMVQKITTNSIFFPNTLETIKTFCKSRIQVDLFVHRPINNKRFEYICIFVFNLCWKAAQFKKAPKTSGYTSHVSHADVSSFPWNAETLSKHVKAWKKDTTTLFWSRGCFELTDSNPLHIYPCSKATSLEAQLCTIVR